MSVYPTAWVLRYSEERLGNRLVLLVLADKANDDGTGAWPSVDTISRESRLSRRAVQECLRSLESSGAIVERGKSRAGTHVYDVVMGGAESAPGGAESDVEGAQETARGGAVAAPEPSREPSEVQPSRELARASLQRARTWSVDRKLVSDVEARLADYTLGVWNEATGQRLNSTGWHAKIVRRIREHPDLTLDDHAAIIYATLGGKQWWDGPPSPSIIYGNDAQFERSMEQARQAATAGARGALAVALDEQRRMEEQR